jgi:hypothetical protein
MTWKCPAYPTKRKHQTRTRMRGKGLSTEQPKAWPMIQHYNGRSNAPKENGQGCIHIREDREEGEGEKDREENLTNSSQTRQRERSKPPTKGIGYARKSTLSRSRTGRMQLFSKLIERWLGLDVPRALPVRSVPCKCLPHGCSNAIKVRGEVFLYGLWLRGLSPHAVMVQTQAYPGP